MLNFYSNDLEIIISIILIAIFTSLLSIILYDFIKSRGKLYLNILKMKMEILNKDTWHDENNKILNDTKAIELDFLLQIRNNKNSYDNIYDFNVVIKRKNKYQEIKNNSLNLVDTGKSLSGSTAYQKLKYVNLLPFEVNEEHIKIKLLKDEVKNLKKEPIYILFKTKNKKGKINLNNYLKLDKKKKK